MSNLEIYSKFLCYYYSNKELSRWWCSTSFIFVRIPFCTQTFILFYSIGLFLPPKTSFFFPNSWLANLCALPGRCNFFYSQYLPAFLFSGLRPSELSPIHVSMSICVFLVIYLLRSHASGTLWV